MNLGDVFFAIGIILISTLLVFVVYDDITNPYPNVLNGDMDMNVSKGYNITEKDIELIPNDDMNKTINANLSSKTKATYSVSSESTTSPQKSNSKTGSVQSSNSPKNDENTNIKTYSPNSEHYGYSNTINDKTIRQNKPVEQKKQNTASVKPMT